MATATKHDTLTARSEFNERFPFADYELSADVPIVDEFTRANGEKVGKRELDKLCAAANMRIADSGDYVPLTVGHTPDDPDAPEHKQPAIIGYAGPFRVEKFGAVNPRWAIIAENWAIERPSLGIARKHPRRSPEILFDAKSGDPLYLDPIALLGARTPRRALGLKLSAEGHVRERCEMAMAGASSTYTPGVEETEKNGAGSGNNADLVSRLINELETTDVFVWARSKMKEEMEAGEEEPGMLNDEDTGEEMDGDGDKPGEESDAEDGEKETNAEDDEGDEKSESESSEDPDESSDEDEDDDKEKNMSTATKANTGTTYKERLAAVSKERDTYKERLAAKEKELATLKGANSGLSARVEKLEAEQRCASRKEKLRALHATGRQFDVEKEFARVEKLSDDAFNVMVESLETNVQPVPIGRGLPEGHNPVGELSMDKREKNAAEAEKVARREKIPYGEALERVMSNAK